MNASTSSRLSAARKSFGLTPAFIGALSRKLALATLAMCGLGEVAAAPVTWTGTTGGTPGDGLNWNDPLNWDTDTVPTPFDDLTFGTGTPGFVHLNTVQAVNSLSFNENFSLGAYGNNLTLVNSLGTVSVNPGKFATIHAAYGGSGGLTVFGGGSLHLSNVQSPFLGGITVDGAGSTLVYRGESVAPQYNGVGGTQLFGRNDSLSLGYSTTVKTISLINGGELKIVGAGNNPEGNHKNVTVSSGSGAYNVAAGFLQMNLDDAGQISNSVGTTLIKRGAGRLTIGGAMADANPLAGDIVVEKGVFELSRNQGGVTTANTRFAGITGTNTNATNSLTVGNGGVLALTYNNGGAVANLDVATVIANTGSIFGFANASHEIGMRTQGGTTGASTFQVAGSTTIMHRDYFNPQTSRNIFINSDLTGSGTLNILPGTNAGGVSRLVLQRAVASTFDGTFRMLENSNLELNPRANAVVDIGKLMAGGDVEFAGWGSTLDLRDSDSAAANVKDYTANEVNLTTTQRGNLNIIAPIRATTASGTGHLFNFGTLTMGNHRLAIGGNNNYMTGFADTASIRGNAVFELRSVGSHLVFNNTTSAIAEDAAGRSLMLIKTGASNAAAADVISSGPISVSNIEIHTGSLLLRGSAGAIAPGFGGGIPSLVINGGGAVGATRDMPTQGLLHLDSNGSTLTAVTAGNHATGDRVPDNVPVVMRGNSGIRLTSLAGQKTAETLGSVSVGGHSLFDVVKTGSPTEPAALTINSLTLGANATVNFTGTTLGVAGGNTSRIVLPGTAAGAMPSQFHQGNEWAKYDNTVESGLEIGVTPFTVADYVLNTPENSWVSTDSIKTNTAAATTVLFGNRSIARLNQQFTATSATTGIDLNGSILTIEQGGILTSGANVGFFDTNASFPTVAGGLTAGTTTPAKLYMHSNVLTDIRVPIINNLGADLAVGGGDDSVVDFVKSGTGTVRLVHHSLTVGLGNQGGSLQPFTTPTWSSTMTGSWIINDGTLNVHRGQFLNGRPVVLNGGTLEINHPVSPANASSILPGWGNTVTVNGNAMLGMDDNGESADAGVGGNTIALMGALTINNGSTLGWGSFNNMDIAFAGAAFNGRGTINIGPNRTATNSNMIINGAVTGSGFDVVSYVGAPGSIVLGGSITDTAENTFDTGLNIYAGIVRLNKANGKNAIPDTLTDEDVVINGGSLVWGPGHHGDLLTTNNLALTNNNLTGLAPTSPAGLLAAGMNQIADNATLTLLAGSLGEADRFNNETFATLNQKNGTLNVGLGTMEIGTANVTGGSFSIDRGGTFKVGTLNLLPGAYSPAITTGLPAGAMTTLDIGAGGINLSGQNITLGTGSSGNVSGSGAVLKLRGNLTVTTDATIGTSYNTGIYIQTGSSFREIGNSRIDLDGGNRTFTIPADAQYYVTVPITNGGLTKSGAGSLNLEPYLPSTFTGPIAVLDGVLSARGDGAFGTSAGGVNISSGATVRLDSSWNYGDDFTVSGPGALIPGESNLREFGALVNETGYNRLTGAFVLAGGATVASSGVVSPSVVPATGGAPFSYGSLVIAAAGGVTGTGTLTLTGLSDGVIVNGLNTSTGGLTKEGSGRWTLPVASSYTGATLIAAGNLRITHANALGTTATGTTVVGGALELEGGLTIAEPFRLFGPGSSLQSGAIVNVSGDNTLTAPIQLVGAVTLRSKAGSLVINAPVTGSDGTLTLAGTGNGLISSALANGAAGFVGISKTGAGTWTLSGANTIFGSTTVAAGTLVLNYATQNNSKINAGETINLEGGNVSVVGHPTAATTQAVSGLNVNAGGGTVAITGGVSGATLDIGTISRNQGGTVRFAPGSGGKITTSTITTEGIIGGFATVGSDWATVTAGEVAAFNGYTTLATDGTPNTNNSRLTNSLVLPFAQTTNTLKIAGGQGLALGANTLNLTAGGLIVDSPASYVAIVGSGTLSGLDASSELIIHTAAGTTLDVGAQLIGFGGGALTKTGAGKLFLGGTSGFTGNIHVNEGTVEIAGTGGTHPGALGSQVGQRNILLNGGTFSVLGDYDLNVNGGQQMQIVAGTNGGTVRNQYGTIILNDAGQLSGSGDLVFTGGGRYALSPAGATHTGFTGNVTVEKGVITLGHTAALGGRAEQVVTLKPGTLIINNTGFGLGLNGLPNNLVVEGGVEIFALGGTRGYTGQVQFVGTNTVGLMERDNISQERQLDFTNRVSGNNITLNVVGVNNGNPMYLQSGANDFTGTLNMGTNAALEVRIPGSIGVNPGDVTVNLNGVNSRILLRHYQNGDFRTNVVMNDHSEINSDRLVNYGGGGSQYLSINNLTVNGNNKLVTFNGGNAFTTRVGGTATFNGNAVLTAVGGAGVLFENGINFANGADTLEKRGTSSVVLRGPANHTGPTIVHAGFLILQGANGALPNTSEVNLRGGELRIDNSEALNPNRVNDSAAIKLGGGVLRITGPETLGTVSAVAGTTQIVYNPISDTNVTALTLNGFTRAVGSVVQFQSPDLGTTTVGATSFGQPRIASRILIPGQADAVGTEVIAGFLGNNGIDFVQYDGTTIDSGLPLGVRDTRNVGNSTLTFAVPYTDNTAETAWNDSVVLRSSTAAATITLTAPRALEAWKIEAATTVNLGANNLRIEHGGILLAGNNTTTFNTTGGTITAGSATPGVGVAELFISGNNAAANPLTFNASIVNNGSQPVALVKTGTGLAVLGVTSNYTGGTYVNAGTLRATSSAALGNSSNPINLSGGTLDISVGDAVSGIPIAGFGQPITVNSNSVMILDNGALAGTDNDLSFGGITIPGPYTLGIRAFDSMDATYTGAHAFTGNPTIDLPQAGSGSNPNTVATASIITLAGPISGSGFFVTSSANTNDTASRLRLGNGENTPNTYSGKVTLVQGSNSEDLFVELNKAPGTDAITGELQIDGGNVVLIADEQIANTSTVTINRGVMNFNGRSETIASVKMNGGGFITNPTTGTPGANTVNITGDVDVLGGTNFSGVTTGFTIGNNSTVNIGGMLRIGAYGRVHLSEGATAGVLNINGGLEMTGSLLSQNNGAGPNIVRLSSNVQTFASNVTANIGNSTDSDTFLELNGSRIFNVADGDASLDLALSTVIRDSTNPGVAGALIKAGPGTAQLQGGGTANSYTGGTLVVAGTLILNKNVGVNAIPGTLDLGDGTGGAKADRVIVRNSNQISDNSAVNIASSGVLDLDTFNTSEAIGDLSGSGAVDLGPNSAFTVTSLSDTIFSGVISGGGSFVKAGGGNLVLSNAANHVLGGTAVNGGTLTVTGVLSGSDITLNGGAVLAGTGTVGNVISLGGLLSPGDNGVGTLNTGSLDLSSGGMLADFSSASSFDQVKVTGSILLAGSFTPTALASLTGTEIFPLVLNDGIDPIVGTFLGLNEGAQVDIGGTNFTITYVGNAEASSLTGGNDIIIYGVPEPGSVSLLLGGMALLAGARRRRSR